MKNHIVSVGSVSGPEDLKKAIQDLVIDVLERGYEEPDDVVVLVSCHLYEQLMKEVMVNYGRCDVMTFNPAINEKPALRLFGFTIHYHDSLPEDMVVISDSGFLETMKILTDRIIRRAVEIETENLRFDLLRRIM